MTSDTNDHRQLDHLLSNSAARLDRWRDLNAKAQAWAAEVRCARTGAGAGPVQEALADLRPMESYFAYPGVRLLHALDERIADGDGMGAARLILRMSNSLLSGSYRYDEGEWQATEEFSAEGPDRTPPGLAGSHASRPYFEALFVSPAPAARAAAITREIRELRRHDDPLIYEPVLVGSVEDALLATILNGKLEAVVIYDGIPIPSKHDAPLLRDFLSVYEHLT